MKYLFCMMVVLGWGRPSASAEEAPTLVPGSAVARHAREKPPAELGPGYGWRQKTLAGNGWSTQVWSWMKKPDRPVPPGVSQEDIPSWNDARMPAHLTFKAPVTEEEAVRNTEIYRNQKGRVHQAVASVPDPSSPEREEDMAPPDLARFRLTFDLSGVAAGK